MSTRIPEIVRRATPGSPQTKKRFRGTCLCRALDINFGRISTIEHLGKVPLWMKARKELYRESSSPVPESDSSSEEESTSEEEPSVLLDNALDSDEGLMGPDVPYSELPLPTSSVGLSNLVAEILPTVIRTNALSRDGEAQLSRVRTTALSQLRPKKT